MSLNFAQWGLADLSNYNSNTARNLSILGNLSLTGMTNALYDIYDGALIFDSVWDENLIRSTYEGAGNPGPSDTVWRELLVEAQKIRGFDGHAPRSEMTAPDTGTQRLDGRLAPISAEGVAIFQSTSP